jgi:dienelactone hydrolase
MPLSPPEGYSYANWLKDHTVDITEPEVKKAIEWLRGEGGYKKIGVVGYCYGAKYAIRALGDGGADVGFVGHPAFVDKEEVEAIKGPLSIAAAGGFYPFHLWLLGFTMRSAYFRGRG